MKLKTKSNLIITTLTLVMVLGVFALAVGTTRGDNSQIQIVVPSGGDDTDEIQDAFEAVGPEGTVQLIEGDYYVDNIIVEGFCGRFKGAGMGRTTIDVYNEVTPDPINSLNILFKFDGGDIRISDLSFDITYAPVDKYLDYILWFTGEINSNITRVKFTGHEGNYIDPVYTPPGMSWNVYAAISIAGITEMPDGYTTGTHSIMNCKFESVAIGIETFGLVDGVLKIGGRYFAGNTFKGGSYGIRMWNTVNSKIEISHNYIETYARAGLYVTQAFIPDFWPNSWPVMSSQWVITHNSVHTFFGADGLILYDWYLDVEGTYNWETSIQAVLSHNHITLDNEAWGGMVIIGVDDAYIINNVITGVGDYGLDVWECNNLKIFGNRIQIDARGTIGNDWGLFYGMSLWFGFNNVISFNRITHKEADGLFVLASNENLILGNLINHNGGYGLYMEASNDNCITANILYDNLLDNILDDSTTNHYHWNWEH